jgi:phenylpropionate dioxygenase-like ring-hydroxylating dioxygenase large terminal subunit
MTIVEACESKTNTTPEFPMGWYSVGLSHELQIGEVTNVSAFDREFALYRTRSGATVLQDAFCPHLGAHLGVEGRVVGESIRCPFHGWRFGSESGICEEIPYCDEIPPRARLRTWHCEEKHGTIWIWFHPENTAPQWQLPDIPEFDDDNWTTARLAEFDVPAHVQDIAENSCDPVHFQFVHRQPDIPPSVVTVEEDGRTLHLNSDASNAAIPSQLDVTVYSPGHALVRNTYGPGAEMIVYNSAQPVDKHNTKMRWSLLVRREIEDLAGDDVMKGIIDGLSDDYPIWANKVHKHRPVFCRGDDTLVLFRKWVRQFYVTSEDKRDIA